jgi:hypothetical protein
MKRVKRVVARSDRGEIHIAITVKSTWGLTRGEVDTVTTALADDAMRSIAGVRYLAVPLSKIVVE